MKQHSQQEFSEFNIEQKYHMGFAKLFTRSNISKLGLGLKTVQKERRNKWVAFGFKSSNPICG